MILYQRLLKGEFKNMEKVIQTSLGACMCCTKGDGKQAEVH